MARHLLLGAVRDHAGEAVEWARRLLTVRNVLLVVLALALWLRLVYVTELPGQSIRGLQPFGPLLGDAARYDSIATNLIEGKGYRNTKGEDPVPVLPPAYPTFLAATYKLTAHSYSAVRIAQAFLGAATCAVVYLIGRKAFNPATGIIAALLAAAYPWFIFWNRFLITETLFIFLLSLGVLTMLWAVEKPLPRNLAAAGLLLALANLTHTSVPILPVLFAGWLLPALGWRQGARAAGIFLAFFFLALVPWTARNYAHYQQVLPVSALGGLNLYVANNPYTIADQPHTSNLPDRDPVVMQEVEGKPFLEQDRILRNKAINYIFDHPGTLLSNGWKRVKVFWEEVPAPAVFNMPLLRSEYYRENVDRVLLLAFAAGAAVALVRWRTAVVLLLVPLQYSLLHVFFPVNDVTVRARLPAMLVAIVLAAFAVYAAWSLFTNIPLWACAVRSGMKERSLHSTWRLLRTSRKSQ